MGNDVLQMWRNALRHRVRGLRHMVNSCITVDAKDGSTLIGPAAHESQFLALVEPSLLLANLPFTFTHNSVPLGKLGFLLTQPDLRRAIAASCGHSRASCSPTCRSR